MLVRTLAMLLCCCALLESASADVFVNTPPPGVDPNDPHFVLGYLDVTQAPYFADSTGTADATAQIQNAINDAIAYQLACFFPPGAYLVSDTLNAMQDDRDYPCVMVGGKQGGRPVLKLAPVDASFDDALNPKPLIWIWRRPQGEVYTDPTLGEKANSAFNQIFRGIDIDLSGGHAGAVGMRFAASQGSTLEDVSIDATGAFAGVINCPGQGGGTHNLSVEGGRYGVYMESITRFPTIVAGSFHNQTQRAMFFETSGQRLVVVGANIVQASGVAIETRHAAMGVTLVDSRVEFTNGGGTIYLNQNNKSDAYFERVFMRGADQLLQTNTTAWGPNDPNTWTEVALYAQAHSLSEAILDGALDTPPPVAATSNVTPPSVAALQAPHKWVEADAPFFQDPDAMNVRALGAVGDGVHDDTLALQAAIDLHPKVFLPKGVYRISDTLRLGVDTTLFGVAPMYSVILGGAGWGASGTPIVETVDNAEAETSLSFVSITYDGDGVQFNNLAWRAGRNSMIRDVHASITAWPSVIAAEDHQVATITGNGGGRWFAFSIWNGRFGNISHHPNFRHYLIDGTRQPLTMYAVNFERAATSPQSEIRNARNIRIYYLKAEAGSSGADSFNTPLLIDGSSNVAIYGSIGSIRLVPGEAVLKVRESRDIRAVQYSSFHLDPNWATFVEDYLGDVTTVPGSERLAIFQRGAPHPYDSGDLDHDGDVDAADLAILTACLTGPGAFFTGMCTDIDLDADGDGDLMDFLEFQQQTGD